MPDAVIVGAGPAGLSAALALRRFGFAVSVIEQHPFPPPRVCGAFINPEGAGYLAALGLGDEIVRAGAVPVVESRLSWAGGREVDVSILRGGRAGLALPRPALERVMADAFQAMGGNVEWGRRATGFTRTRRGWTLDVVEGKQRVPVEARLLVIADGRFSTLSGRPLRKTRAGWFGWNATFDGVAQAPGALSLHFHRGGYVGVLTFADGLSNVCGLVELDARRTARWEEVLGAAVRELPPLARLLRAATRVDAFRGVGPLPFSTGMSEAPGVVLAGDAAAVGDPYMGEGISRALGTGPALQAALEQEPRLAATDAAFEAYNRVWRSRYSPRLRLGSVSRWLIGHPRLAAPLVGHVVSRPRLLQRVLAIAHAAGGQV